MKTTEKTPEEFHIMINKILNLTAQINTINHEIKLIQSSKNEYEHTIFKLINLLKDFKLNCKLTEYVLQEDVHKILDNVIIMLTEHVNTHIDKLIHERYHDIASIKTKFEDL